MPDDDQSEFSVNVRLPRGTSFERTIEYVPPIEGELRTALGDNLEALMVSIQNGSANYSIQLTPIEAARAVAAGADAGRAPGADAKYRNARTSVSGGTDISGASSGGGGRGGGGGGGRTGCTMILQGPDIEELQKLAYAARPEGRQLPAETSLLTRSARSTA